MGIFKNGPHFDGKGLAASVALVKAGATVVGSPPLRSPGLSGYPACDAQVQSLAKTLWGQTGESATITTRRYGLGQVIFGGELDKQINDLYPEYELTAAILKQMQVHADFEADQAVRYTHRSSAGWDIYFVANKTADPEKTKAVFRSAKGAPELWDAITGEMRKLPQFKVEGSQTNITLQFEPYQSYFIVFHTGRVAKPIANKDNFPVFNKIETLSGPWQISFDQKRGGPAKTTFNELSDWTKSPVEGIKYYSGIAVYKKEFNLQANVSIAHGKIYLDLGDIKNLARVKLNGKDLGVIWTAPWHVDISSAIKQGNNQLDIEVANLWVNRLIGDEKLPDDGIKDDKWPDWLIKGLPRPSGRITFSTFHPYNQNSPLFKSGLLGPVTLQQSSF
ncbi:glycosylhydrolase-like jelly roll fold domain-containing protein [uncultured Mucilaginibacter sp.]|uniref:glycosylhydrolase-like jelly roll fold domain-containing protein n=1 Tax=uncultured Mucilaginibacter sp. TaxID=797541 RepID=UPI0025F35001|nr:glycosylhydrolase-like jelly roll fold domain-containing protein [uncultured Mucilaginibacter sp.]